MRTKGKTDKQHQKYIDAMIKKVPKLEKYRDDDRVSWKNNSRADEVGVWIEVQRRDVVGGRWSTAAWLLPGRKYLITGNEKISYLFKRDLLERIAEFKQITTLDNLMSRGFHLRDDEIPVDVVRL